MQIALIGGGIASVGALKALDSFLARAGSRAVVHRYAAGTAGAVIRSNFCAYEMPPSSGNGYLERWGALICLSPSKSAAYEDMLGLLCPQEVTAALSGGIGKSFDQDSVPYYCASRDSVSRRVAVLAESLSASGVLLETAQGVARIVATSAGWILHTHRHPDGGPVYDAVVLAAGALATPRLLAASGLISIERPLPLKDHVIIFGSPERPEKYTLHPGRKTLQFVSSGECEIGVSHDVLLDKPAGFDGPDMAAIYCSVAGRRVKELLNDQLGRLVAKVAGALCRKPWPLGQARQVRAKVGDENHCAARLLLGEKVPTIEWETQSAPHAVSAFHFHGSLEGWSDRESLRKKGLHLGDLSATSSVRDMNTGAFSFQAGYSAMADALRGVR